MRSFHLGSWLKGVFGRRRVERDMADEMAFHLQARTDHWVRQGLPAGEAARRARLEFGAVDGYKEDCRQARGLRWVDELRGDLVYAGRALRASPIFTLVAVAILAIAIGANTAIFSVVEAVMLRRLPVVRPDELRQLAWIEPPNTTWQMRYDGSTRTAADGGRVMTSFSWPIYTELRRRTTSFASLFLFASRDVNLDAGGRAQQAQALMVSGSFQEGLGAAPFIGRGIGPADDRVEAPAVVVLSHRLFQRAFGGDPRVVGQAIRVNGTPAIVIGVTQPSFEGLQPGRPFDVMVPVSSFAALIDGERPLDERRFAFGVMGRLRTGVDDVRTTAETDALFRAALPRVLHHRRGRPAAVRPVPGRPGPRSSPPGLCAPALPDHGDHGGGVVHRLRQRGRPAADAHGGAAARDGDAPGARRRTGPAGAPAPHRERRPGGDRRGCRRGARLRRPGEPAAGAEPRGRADRSDARPEPVGARLLDRHVSLGGARLRHPAGAAGHAGRRPAFARPHRGGGQQRRATALRGPDADRAPGRALAGPGGGRRALHALAPEPPVAAARASAPITCCCSAWTRARPATRMGGCSTSTRPCSSGSRHCPASRPRRSHDGACWKAGRLATASGSLTRRPARKTSASTSTTCRPASSRRWAFR